MSSLSIVKSALFLCPAETCVWVEEVDGRSSMSGTSVVCAGLLTLACRFVLVMEAPEPLTPPIKEAPLPLMLERDAPLLLVLFDVDLLE